MERAKRQTYSNSPIRNSNSKVSIKNTGTSPSTIKVHRHRKLRLNKKSPSLKTKFFNESVNNNMKTL